MKHNPYNHVLDDSLRYLKVLTQHFKLDKYALCQLAALESLITSY